MRVTQSLPPPPILTSVEIEILYIFRWINKQILLLRLTSVLCVLELTADRDQRGQKYQWTLFIAAGR